MRVQGLNVGVRHVAVGVIQWSQDSAGPAAGVSAAAV